MNLGAFDPFRHPQRGLLRPWFAAELSEAQRIALRGLLADPEAEPFLGQDALEVGLWGGSEGLERLLGDQRGPLEQSVLVGDESWPTWFAIYAVAEGRMALESLLEALGRRDRVAIVDAALDEPYRLYRTNAPRDWDDPQIEQRDHNRASAFVDVLVALLEDSGAAGVARASAMMAALVPEGRYRSAVPSYVAALVLARDAERRGIEAPAGVDALLRCDLVPADLHVRTLRRALTHLPFRRREAILAPLELYSYQRFVDPTGEVVCWRPALLWDLVDLLPTETCAAAVSRATQEYVRHRAVGLRDPHATPIRSTVRTSDPIVDPAPSDSEFPHERARALLAAEL